MIKETSLCMGCMNDKTYDGPCKLCGYSDNTPNIPTYLAPKTFLADRYIVGKVISYNGEGRGIYRLRHGGGREGHQ